MKSSLCRFYGWSDDYILTLDFKTFNSYYECIQVIEARELLSQCNISMLPHVDKDYRSSYIKKLESMAYTVRKSVGKVLTNAEFIKLLRER